MCGINGIIKSSEIERDVRKDIETMNNSIVHRGPDDEGIYHARLPKFEIGMGMRRLSIIDLNSGHQPILSEDENQIIVFNGEIYNYREIRNDLTSKGVYFKTQSDTEVILQLYLNEGIKGFSRLDGMYAFSIYDKTLNKVLIGRDFFGEKPLYFTDTNEGFYWASELKSILKVYPGNFPISKKGLNLFFRLTYIPAPYSIYDGVYKLRPNNLLVYDLEKQIFNFEEITSYSIPDKKPIPFKEAKLQVRQLVQGSVESRSVSDVPVGTFLSGGVDSSVVSLCLSRMNEQKINTFSIGFEKKGYDETDKSRLVARLIGSQHHEFILKEKDLENNVHEIIANFDEPFADSSALPSYLVAHQTSKFVKVALTGDGGDEVFGGYNKYYMGKINQAYCRWVPNIAHKTLLNTFSPLLHSKTDKRGKRFKLNRLLHAVDYTDQYYWDIISLGFTAGTLEPYLKSNFIDIDVFDSFRKQTGIQAPKNLTEYREIDRNISLEGDMLVKVDRTSMLSSLECRAPFLNRKLWEYTASLPENYLLNGWNKKYILKEAFKQDFPKGFLDKSKAGFGIPIGDWLRSSLKSELKMYASKESLKSQGIFNIESTYTLVHAHLNGKDHTFKVWSFYCFQKWYFSSFLRT
ncbi:asparagine synthase (glutamine-hydrolyzing) [Robiginitalea sp. IMCC44478]|uniref:asparagine synthase (glutamine-hydrolyzing) n=1 Tax=Robiginitalea sp. IMCC44478 TaxID=3459122 RepID=UPI004042264E